ncbi:Heavy metal-associated isoprenylated plant protein [Melia azedarach]|uniref:Heavy metal-associated isoprenylated plant protein n=1 Tax=Melia azedarach TaxID=155640 RepID=A0ACC1YSS7_MELAZ|nr:Heavy metal-associated isoprenylated plant protein [Melia azedarach]
MTNMQIVPAYKNNNVEAQYVELMVPLYSHGCERKVKNTLSHLKGIYSVNVDYNEQRVVVWGICNKYDVLETIRSKRKEARFWNHEDNEILVMEKSESPNISHLPPPKIRNNSKPYLTLIRAQSFKWKALKKVFSRSYSF